MAKDKKRNSSIANNMLVVSFFTLLSRILGLVRDILFAAYWGTGVAMGAFVIAFTIPNLLRGLFGEGALSSAFIPLFSKKLSKKENATAFACNVISVFSIILTLVIIFIIILSYLLRFFIDGETGFLALKLLPLIMPFALFVCIAGILGGILNVYRHFILPALMPVLLNIVLIFSIFFICPIFGKSNEERIFGLAIGVLIAGILQILILYSLLRKKRFKFNLNPSFHSPDIQKMGKLLFPVILGAGVYQVNVLIDRLLAGWLGGTATSSLYYSQRLIYLPVGLFGVALGTVCLPAMSKAANHKKINELLDSLRFSLGIVLFLAIPTTCFFLIFGKEIINIIFLRGNFDSDSAKNTLWAFFFYLPGIPFFASNKVILPAFHSRQDTKTPVKISAICLILNLFLNLILMQFLEQGGLALATSISGIVNFILLLYCLNNELGSLQLRKLPKKLSIIAIALIPSLFVSYTLKNVFISETLLKESHVEYSLFTLAVIFLGGLLYCIFSWILGSEEIRMLIHKK
ncbi:MAG: murein biosynthesis integral membrane protein MurJ [Verrucomicrobiota bacterium]|nr:murein biosynthesis integral membrane protein MurJ [Verrucomicrobiota bacterium]